jgi:hypothetical protein
MGGFWVEQFCDRNIDNWVGWAVVEDGRRCSHIYKERSDAEEKCKEYIKLYS